MTLRINPRNSGDSSICRHTGVTTIWLTHPQDDILTKPGRVPKPPAAFTRTPGSLVNCMDSDKDQGELQAGTAL